MTHLCVAIFVTDFADAKRDIAAAENAGAQIIELRIDRMQDATMLPGLLKAANVPCIVTCRPVWEGGQCELEDSERATLLSMAADDGAAYIDIELKSATAPLGEVIEELPRERRVGLIISSHDFNGRPDHLYRIVGELSAGCGDISKIVWAARSIRDNLEAFEILQQRVKPTIALCMGEAGLISRILAKKFGAFLTFASLDSAGGTAPGQVSIADMKGLYRWDRIGEKTRVYGVVAQPVMHSMSPAIHNAAFDAINYDGVYLPLLVETSYESFKAFMETFLSFPGLDLSGLSITIPHKENALRYLQEKGAEIEPLAQAIGAVNTIVIDRLQSDETAAMATDKNVRPTGDERAAVPIGQSKIEKRKAKIPLLRGLNTDYAAILDSITTKLSIAREDLSGYRVAVLGAGGTGRTAVAALAHYGATIFIHNRTSDRAAALAAEFNGHRGPVGAVSMEELLASDCHIFINTTSVGMYPNIDASPFGDRPPRLSDRTLVFDTIYNPMKTKFLAQAESAGAKTIGGVEMFVRQAAAQFQAWTGETAPADVMRQVIERRLSR